jgi:uncharacterized small protein (DUF1192 family)
MVFRSRLLGHGERRPVRFGRPVIFLLWITTLLGAVHLLAPTVLRAAESDPTETGVSQIDSEAVDRRLRELEAQLAALRAEIEKLRAETGKSATPPATLTELEKRIQALTLEIERLRIGEAAAPEATESMYGFGPAASKIYKTSKGVAIGGYGEMIYQNFDNETDGGAPHTLTDQADFLRAVFYFGYKFNDRFLFNSEIEFEHAQAGEGKVGEVAVEFAYIDFKASRSFGARGGLLLVPLGFLNELHEPPIFHGAHRPEVERFIIPTTWRENGVGVYGDAGPVSYRSYVMASLDGLEFSESGGIRGGRQSGAKAKADDVAFTARVDLTPTPGLLLGAAAFTGKVGQGEPGLEDARLTLWDVHGEWRWRGLHLRGLFAKSVLSDARELGTAIAGTPVLGERQQGWYGEIAWDVLSGVGGTQQQLSPFFRYEEYDTQDQVPTGLSPDPAHERTVRVYGITYRPIPNVVLKLDLQNRQNSAALASDKAVDQVNFGLGYMF